MNKTGKIIFMQRYATCFLVFFLLGQSIILADVPGTIKTTGGRKIQGMIRWQPASKIYVVTNPKTGVSMKVPRKKIAGVKIKKPANLEKGINLVKNKHYALAISTLTKIMDKYMMLQWDEVAGKWLAEAYMKQGNPKKAVNICDKIAGNKPQSVMSEDLSRIYWNALLADGKDARLLRILDKTIEQGSREMMAVAQIMRGDIDKKKGNYKKALIDGYLRTIVLFQQIKQVQPEALYKAVKCFEELGQHSYADKMRKKLLVEFPGDSYAKKMKSGV